LQGSNFHATPPGSRHVDCSASVPIEEERCMTTRRSRAGTKRTVRYAVIGLGHIAQAAVLPAFANARRNSQLAALVSDDATKLRTLGRKYDVRHRLGYDELDEFLESGAVDAVYIALPNSHHRAYTELAARRGVHVLCEKPMAVTAADCLAMIEASEQAGVKLMIAYRLHFEAANLRAVELVRSGRLGDPRLFTSSFCMQVRPNNVRLERELGGGPLYDIGIYCINAARYLFRAEPFEAIGVAASGRDGRFDEVPEMVSAVLRFPDGRLASFTCSFGASDVGAYDLVGTQGRLRLDPAYEYAERLELTVVAEGRTQRRRFEKRDQFAPELLYFSDCILQDEEPEPSGWEGLADVATFEAIVESARTQRAVPFELPPRHRRPEPGQETHRPPARRTRLVRTASASQ
jgi:glucose-fructose oxidoreductase